MSSSNSSQGTILTVTYSKDLEDLPNFDHFLQMVELQTKLVVCSKSMAQNDDLKYARWQHFLPPRYDENYSSIKDALMTFCEGLVESVTKQMVVKKIKFVRDPEEEEEEDEDCCAEAIMTHLLNSMASVSAEYPGVLAKVKKQNPQLFEFLDELEESEEEK